jgi:FtsH-binding integral membrane protein
MQQYQGYPQAQQGAFGQTQADSREKFIVKTYNHLFGAIILFAAIEAGLFMTGLAVPMAQAMLGVNWMLVLGAFIVVSWLASRAAHMSLNKTTQYAALAAYVVAEAIIFVPLLVIANTVAPGVIQSAALVTMAGFAGLTGVAFWTRKDFSFLGGFIRFAGIMALVAIVAALIFGFQLGTWFSVGMIGLAGAAILYDTSKIMRTFPEDRYVAAALQLFASVALMFWYVISLFLSRD